MKLASSRPLQAFALSSFCVLVFGCNQPTNQGEQAASQAAAKAPTVDKAKVEKELNALLLHYGTLLDAQWRAENQRFIDKTTAAEVFISDDDSRGKPLIVLAPGAGQLNGLDQYVGMIEPIHQMLGFELGQGIVSSHPARDTKVHSPDFAVQQLRFCVGKADPALGKTSQGYPKFTEVAGFMNCVFEFRKNDADEWRVERAIFTPEMTEPAARVADCNK